MKQLILETKEQRDKSEVSPSLAVTPPIGEDYWLYRVEVSENQAIVAFPKFFTVGVGFQNEEDWNTNLPASSEAKEILSHIWHNRGAGNNSARFKNKCLRAIELIQKEIRKTKTVESEDKTMMGTGENPERKLSEKDRKILYLRQHIDALYTEAQRLPEEEQFKEVISMVNDAARTLEKIVDRLAESE